MHREPVIDYRLDEGCVVCGPGVAYTEHEVSEGMYRTGETFVYRECSGCGSLQIAEVPADLGRYYARDSYYSLEDSSSAVSDGKWRREPWRTLLRLNTAVYLRTGFGRGLDWARRARMRPGDRILDVGCGRGEALLRLHVFGFRHLAGADPFIDGDREVAPGVPVWKRYHDELDGEYDWVMMHHSFEHVPDPRATLASARRLLAPNGRILIRMPIMGRSAWAEYGTNWVQIDPPRHLVVYTLGAIEPMAEEEGFAIERVFWDSTAFQFWGSELVAAGIPHKGGPDQFSALQLRDWERRAAIANANDDGDQAGLVLRPV